jgi:hypothetical protein
MKPTTTQCCLGEVDGGNSEPEVATALDDAVCVYWEQHGTMMLIHQLASWLLTLTQHRQAVRTTIRIDDCGLVTAEVIPSAMVSEEQAVTETLGRPPKLTKSEAC